MGRWMLALAVILHQTLGILASVNADRRQLPGSDGVSGARGAGLNVGHRAGGQHCGLLLLLTIHVIHRVGEVSIVNCRSSSSLNKGWTFKLYICSLSE